MKRFGEKLRTLRKRHGLSIRKLTREFGYSSHSYISRIETGKTKPSIEFIIKIADRFGVSVDQLVRDELEIE
jgi:transcriptional regulator with XRE-family HTH domain